MIEPAECGLIALCECYCDFSENVHLNFPINIITDLYKSDFHSL
ncbi:hypothetical protein RintRC_1251 [Richelia intracellularis]|nr:hypothetical protein RintRC_1251 [Richelia intracellularis]